MSSGPYGFLGEQESTEDKVTALRNVPIFRGLDETFLYGIARHSAQIRAEAEQVIVREGEPGREFMLILDGSVRVEHGGQTVARMKAGNYFGEMSVIDGKARSATVVADSPAQLLVLDNSVFSGLLDADPRLTRELLLIAVDRLRQRGEDSISE